MNTKEIMMDEKKVKNQPIKAFFKAFNKKHITVFLMLLMMFLSYSYIAYADTGSTAEQKWQQILDFILPWIGRFGGVLALWGGVELGNAWKDDDANGKAKGFKFIMAGVIIIAVSLSANIFLV